MDLVYFLPIHYEDRRRIIPASSAGERESAVVRGRVASVSEKASFRGRKGRFSALVRDAAGDIELVWFHYHRAHLSRLIEKGREILAFGQVDLSGGIPRMVHPEVIEAGVGKDDDFCAIMPVYPAVSGFGTRMLREMIRQALQMVLPVITDPVPAGLIREQGLPSLCEALKYLHVPDSGACVEMLNGGESPAHRRILFDSFFNLMVSVHARAASRNRLYCNPCPTPGDFIRRIREMLPFSLTDSQSAAISEILEDMGGSHPMNRLLMGDVGCGKTVVAAVAARAAGINGFQTAIMAPTQVLASQHFEYFSSLPRQMGFNPLLLTASISGSERLRTLDGIAGGNHNPVIGTQALIQEGPVFHNLGLVVIDEQHRFGVRQRRLLDRKGKSPHMLVMSATPIPRTLAMAIHADLDISVISRFPEGRMPVVTRMAGPEHKKDLYRSLTARLSAGQQALVICPVVEGGGDSGLKGAEEMYSSLNRLLGSRFRVGLVHGRLAAAHKDEVVEKFRKGDIDLLVSTTVVEVGVHAPGATMIIVEHPERFGLAQLHQLRGRVGRGGTGGVCVLVCREGLSREALKRLTFLTGCSGGFEVAEYDMKMRGHGELNGIRQAGSGEVDIRDLLREPALLEAARKGARDVVSRDRYLSETSDAGLGTMSEELPPSERRE